jgi:hypothetical protein
MSMSSSASTTSTRQRNGNGNGNGDGNSGVGVVVYTRELRGAMSRLADMHRRRQLLRYFAWRPLCAAWEALQLADQRAKAHFRRCVANKTFRALAAALAAARSKRDLADDGCRQRRKRSAFTAWRRGVAAKKARRQDDFDAAAAAASERAHTANLRRIAAVGDAIAASHIPRRVLLPSLFKQWRRVGRRCEYSL